MYNALVTRLKGVVTDPSLPKYGIQDFVLVANANTKQVNYYVPPVPYRFKAKITGGNSYFTIGTDATHLTEVDVTTGDNYNTGYVNLVKASGEDFNYELDVYNSSFLCGVVKLEDLLESDSVYIINLQQGTSATQGFIASSGSVNEIGKKFPNLCEFNSQWLGGITGDLAIGFGSCKYLRYMGLRNTMIDGSLEGLCDALLAAGKDGPLGIICNGRITLNGVAVANATQKNITFANGSYTIA